VRFVADLSSDAEQQLFPKLALDVRPIAHEQLGEKTGIPRPYYARMLSEANELLCNNVNHWLSESPKNVLLRTIDDSLRAFLSDRYRVMDSYDVVAIAVDEMRAQREKHGDNRGIVQRMDLSDEKFYLRIVNPSYCVRINPDGSTDESRGVRHPDGTWTVEGENIVRSDWLFGGAVVSNSEVGRGGLQVDAPVIFQVLCGNFTIASTSLRKVHLGERHAAGVYTSEQTLALKDQALSSEIRDLMHATFDQELFRNAVETVKRASEVMIEKPQDAVDNVVKAFGLSDELRQGIFNELVSPSFGANIGMTPWGLVSAITAQAHKSDGVADAYALEEAGGNLLANWKELVPVRVR